MKLIIGLGNPGTEYAWTRHNLGYMVVGALARDKNAEFRTNSSLQAASVKINIGSHSCVCARPLTYMNNSGNAVKALVAKQGITLEDILVVCDDMALPFGHMRLRPEGSAGGHNGIKSIIAHLGTQQFTRLRLGVGRPGPKVDPADYVLKDFTPAEKKVLPDFINQALLCIHSWVNDGVSHAMSRYNTKNQQKD